MVKKTLKFTIDEDHTGFEKVNIKPTKIFKLEDDANDYLPLTDNQLKKLLENEQISENEKVLINKILSSRK